MLRSIDLGERVFGLDTAMVLSRDTRDFETNVMRFSLSQMQIVLQGVMRASNEDSAIRLFDINSLIERLNRVYDEFVEAARIVRYEKQRRRLEKLEERYDISIGGLWQRLTSARRWFIFTVSLAEAKRAMITTQVGEVLTGVLSPAYSAAYKAKWQARMANDLNPVALALAGYRREHGTYPKELAALVPRYLDTVPNDIFVDKPLRYRQMPDGSARVYSVGPDRKDAGWKKETAEGARLHFKLARPE